jgi:hypothetical protein
VTHTYHPNFSGGEDWEDCISRQAQKKGSKTPYPQKKQGMVAWACHPSYAGGVGNRIKAETILEKACKNPSGK